MMGKVTVPMKQSKYDTIAKSPKTKARDSITRTPPKPRGKKTKQKGVWG